MWKLKWRNMISKDSQFSSILNLNVNGEINELMPSWLNLCWFIFVIKFNDNLAGITKPVKNLMLADIVKWAFVWIFHKYQYIFIFKLIFFFKYNYADFFTGTIFLMYSSYLIGHWIKEISLFQKIYCQSSNLNTFKVVDWQLYDCIVLSYESR